MRPGTQRSRPEDRPFHEASQSRDIAESLSPDFGARVAVETSAPPGAVMKLVRIATLAIAALATSPSFAAEELKWSAWGDDLFTRATAEKRFVILDLEAVWCHWCHVMEKTTYANAEVKELLASKYLPVRVDQDANPDLSSRYGDWGWPATIVFGPDGTEIAKIRGYIEPERMQALLKAIIDDPSPGPSVGEAFEVKPSTSAFLDKERRAALTKNVDEAYDEKLGSWGENEKYIDADSMDLAIARAETGDATDRPGLGRRLPVFRSGVLDQSPFRKDHVVPGAVSPAIQPGPRAVEGSKISRRSAHHRTLSRGIPDQPRRRVLCQPGCRSQPRRRRSHILRSIGRRAPQTRHAAHRQESLRPRKWLGDFR